MLLLLFFVFVMVLFIKMIRKDPQIQNYQIDEHPSTSEVATFLNKHYQFGPSSDFSPFYKQSDLEFSDIFAKTDGKTILACIRCRSILHYLVVDLLCVDSKKRNEGHALSLILYIYQKYKNTSTPTYFLIDIVSAKRPPSILPGVRKLGIKQRYWIPFHEAQKHKCYVYAYPSSPNVSGTNVKTVVLSNGQTVHVVFSLLPLSYRNEALSILCIDNVMYEPSLSSLSSLPSSFPVNISDLDLQFDIVVFSSSIQQKHTELFSEDIAYSIFEEAPTFSLSKMYLPF